MRVLRRSLFLKWALANAVFVTALALGAFSYHGHLHVTAKLAMGACLLLYAGASTLLGRIAWHPASFPRIPRAENMVLRRWYADVEFCIDAMPAIAMMGTISGFLIAFQNLQGDVQQRILGSATAFAATFVGIGCMQMLKTLLRMVQRET